MNQDALSRLVAQAVSQTLKQKNGLSDMNLKAAQELTDRVLQKAAAEGISAVIAVANKSARPVAVACMDDAYIASYDIALNKAYTSAALKMDTRRLKELSQPGGPLYGVQHTNQGKIVIFGGGVPLFSGDRLIGALGISGGSEAQDTALAEYGGAIFEEVLLCL